MHNCSVCGKPSGIYELCELCAEGEEIDSLAWAKEAGLCNEDGTPIEAEEETAPPVDDTGLALVVDGVRVDEDGVRRLMKEVQLLKIGLLNEVIAHNHTRQLVARLEVELMDSPVLPTYSITPAGYDFLREMGQGA